MTLVISPGRGAKPTHAVLLGEMERGSLRWEDTGRIDRVRRAHAQKHVPSSKQNWARAEKAFSRILAVIRETTRSMAV